jgi:hypothetical protein
LRKRDVREERLEKRTDGTRFYSFTGQWLSTLASLEVGGRAEHVGDICSVTLFELEEPLSMLDHHHFLEMWGSAIKIDLNTPTYM